MESMILVKFTAANNSSMNFSCALNEEMIDWGELAESQT